MRQQMANNGTCADFHSIAAVFNDGTVSGDLEWINGVIADRRQAYQDIAKATEILKTAIAKGSETPGVIQELTDWRKSEAPAGMNARPSATHGPSWGYQSRGTAPPKMRMSRSPVPGAHSPNGGLSIFGRYAVPCAAPQVLCPCHALRRRTLLLEPCC
jgi:hypothetical protein